MANIKIGIVVADNEEYLPLADMIIAMGGKQVQTNFRQMHTVDKNGITYNAVYCGIGKVNAATSAMYLVGQGCQYLLNYGYSGGVSGVKKGEYVIADRFMEHDFDLTVLGYKPCEKPGQAYIYNADENLLKIAKALFSVKNGLALCGDRFISDDKTRTFMSENFGAMSCDMETAAIASVCHQFDIPFIAIRKISDDAGDDASVSYKEAVTEKQAGMAEMILLLAEKIGEDL